MAPGHKDPAGDNAHDMNKPVIFLVPGLVAAFALSACGEKAPESSAPTSPPEEATAPLPSSAPADGEPRALTAEEQRQVLDRVMQARAKQQAEGLGSGSVRVNGAWHYTGYSHLSPDPSAAIEARLVAVDVTVSGHTPFFDIDDIEVVDGVTMISYGSDPHAEFLTPDGALLGEGQLPPTAPDPVRLLLIYGFPKNTTRLHLYYWGKQLTANPVEIGASGLALPYPATE